MKKIADFIVDKRKIILLLFIVMIVYSVWGMSQVSVEYDITAYLPQDTDTRRALSIMNEEFETLGMASLIVENVSFEEADALYEQIKELDGVKIFTFENTEDYYKDSCALFSVTYDGDKEDPVSVAAYERMIELLEPYDYYVASAITDDIAAMLTEEVARILVAVVIIIIIVILFTSESYFDFVIFLMTFGVAAILNMGTNYWFGTISFVSNTVCVVLQLALAIDYAIILSHRFNEEKERGGTLVDAAKRALSKAIIEISSSSLTTIAGLLALTTMTLRLGADMGIVLAKSIVFSMLTVFLFMPGLLLLFSKVTDKTKHKSLVPKIPFVGRFVVKARYPLIALFLIITVTCAVVSFGTDYVYSSNSVDTHKPSPSQVANGKMDDVFGYSSEFVVLMPGDDFERQKALMEKIESYDGISNAVGLANMEVTMNGETRYLTEGLNYREFADLLAMDDSIADSIFAAYAFFAPDGAEEGAEEMALYQSNKLIYRASLWDICNCAVDHDDFISAYLYYDTDSYEDYRDLCDLISDAKKMLLGKTHTRMLFVIDGQSESPETFALIDRLLVEVKEEYPEAIFAGDSMSSYDLNESFTTDNLMVTLLTAAFVFIILMFTFKSWGLPILLTLTIQGAIFINFAYYELAGMNMFFFVYLIGSAIQMGATIDYAIVITNRFNELKTRLSRAEAVVMAVSDAFPTVMTSGLIMSSAGFLIGEMVTEPMISTMGTCLGRGAVISIIAVMIALPAFLYVFDGVLEKTKFSKNERRVGFVHSFAYFRNRKAEITK